jgi:DeoR/GlpR family transcriptional regulator of sugar metabolism
MNIHSKKIMEMVEKEGVVTSSEVADSLGVSWNTAESYTLRD